jgi:hypothetical protein
VKSKLAIAYLVYGTLVSGAYGFVSLTGWEPATPQREVIPASVRNSPGGYRSYSFWHSGFQGGK